MRAQLRKRAEAALAGGIDTAAACCLVGVVAGSAGVLLVLTPIWAPLFFVSRTKTYTEQDAQVRDD